MKASVATTETLVSQRSAACSPYEDCRPDECFNLTQNPQTYTDSLFITHTVGVGIHRLGCIASRAAVGFAECFHPEATRVYDA